jgi:hypothetical protein
MCVAPPPPSARPPGSSLYMACGMSAMNSATAAMPPPPAISMLGHTQSYHDSVAGLSGSPSYINWSDVIVRWSSGSASSAAVTRAVAFGTASDAVPLIGVQSMPASSKACRRLARRPGSTAKCKPCLAEAWSRSVPGSMIVWMSPIGMATSGVCPSRSHASGRSAARTCSLAASSGPAAASDFILASSVRGLPTNLNWYFGFADAMTTIMIA